MMDKLTLLNFDQSQVNAVLIAGDGWHRVASGSFQLNLDGGDFSFVTADGPATGSTVVGGSGTLSAVRLLHP